jgi:hypothetical protein
MAARNVDLPEDAIFHSDRGSNYQCRLAVCPRRGRRASAKSGRVRLGSGLGLLPRGGTAAGSADAVPGAVREQDTGGGLPVRKAGFNLAFESVA